jgi:hypothetical protein
MPVLTLKFFEQQRSSRALSMQRSGQDFLMKGTLFDDQYAIRQSCSWLGRIAMVFVFVSNAALGSHVE